MEPRRLSRQRARPLRRLPHAQELPRRGQVGQRDLQGGTLDNWVAPDLTGNPRTGSGRAGASTTSPNTWRPAATPAPAPAARWPTWSSYSTSLMSDADRHAIAVYLKSLPASPDAQRRRAGRRRDAAAARRSTRTPARPVTWKTASASRRFFPPLGHNGVLQQADPTGTRAPDPGRRPHRPDAPGRPSPLTMPSFAWKLTDARRSPTWRPIIRNSWGNRAAPVSADAVKSLRHRLGLDRPHLTANSGDHE